MPTSESLHRDIPHFTRDPSLAADIADEFGGGAGNAEQLIAAWELNMSPDLDAANMLPADVEQPDLSYDEIAEAADLDASWIRGYTKRGNYLSFVYEGPDGRTGKEALLIDGDGNLSLSEEARNSPARRALLREREARSVLRDAKSEAERVIAEAKEKAREMLEGVQKEIADLRERSVKDEAEARKAEAESESEDGGEGPQTGNLPARTADADPATDETNKPAGDGKSDEPAGDGKSDDKDDEKPARRRRSS